MATDLRHQLLDEIALEGLDGKTALGGDLLPSIANKSIRKYLYT